MPFAVRLHGLAFVRLTCTTRWRSIYDNESRDLWRSYNREIRKRAYVIKLPRLTGAVYTAAPRRVSSIPYLLYSAWPAGYYKFSMEPPRACAPSVCPSVHFFVATRIAREHEPFVSLARLQRKRVSDDCDDNNRQLSTYHDATIE